jgi:large subunit ribosomal protein L24
MSQKFKIKKGDNVIVTTGRDKGRTGEVLEVIPAASKLKV